MDFSSYTLSLTMADLTIIIHLSDKSDLLFLREKYSDYISHKNYILKVAYYIYLQTYSSNKVLIRNNHYYLSVLPLKKHFRLFNDLLKIVLINILNKNNGFILHASSLVKRNKGHIFVGKEGSGKSTIRELHPGLICLGDDSAILRKIDKKFYLFGSPFYQKTNRAYPNIRVPIFGTYSLNKANYNLLFYLPFPNNLKEILSNVFLSGIDSSGLEQAMLSKTCYEFCSKTNCYSLFFKKHKSFWLLIELSSYQDPFSVKPASILRQMNSRVKKFLPRQISWQPALASWDFLKKCQVINEASWNFEFSGHRKIPEIASLVFSSSVSSPHASSIFQLQNLISKVNDPRWIVILKYRSNFTIIDGNHHAVTLYQLGLASKKNIILRLLVGELVSNKGIALF